MGDARWAVDEIPLPETVLLTFNNGDAGAGKDQEVLLVVKLAMILRTALTGPKYDERVADLLEPAPVALKRTVCAHRLASNPRQITDIRDERAIHPTEHTFVRACTASADSTTIVQQLADHLNVPEKRSRAMLRKEYPAKAPSKGDQWTLTPEMNRRMAELVRAPVNRRIRT
jgi:hypothetical protein